MRKGFSSRMYGIKTTAAADRPYPEGRNESCPFREFKGD